MTAQTFVAGRTATVAEVHVVARRLALRLGCTHALVEGPEHLGAAEMLPGSVEVRLLADGLADLPVERTLFLLSAATLEEAADSSVWDAARAAAAVVVGAAQPWAPGPSGALRLRELAAGKGLRTVHVGLLRATGAPGSRRESPFLVAAGPATAAPLAEVLKAGAHSLALDPEVDTRAAAPREPRVCIASYEVVGPTKNGGIGTANTSLAQALARAGHEVTLLFTGIEEAELEIDVDHWRHHYGDQGISFEVLGSSGRPGSPHPNVRRSYELYEWLLRSDREEPFDVVHFPDCQGHGYFAALAKRYGLAFENTVLVAGAHSSTRWVHEANREPMRWVEPLVTEHMERESVALADVLISPSAYLLDYLIERGWTLPERRYVQQYVLPGSAGGENGSSDRDEPPKELVFFGRLEMRKGLEAFCDALDVLAENGTDAALSVTFMGKAEHVLSEPADDYVAQRARDWPWRWRIVSDFAHADAVAYLRSHPCVAVMPSLVDNSPNTVMEALALGIPIVASRTGGTGELIDIGDLERCSFDGWTGVQAIQPGDHFESVEQFDSGALADRLLKVLAEPSRPARFAVDPSANEEVHVGWHAGVVARGPANGGDRAARHGVEAPSVSLCVVHRDGAGLRETLTGLERQDSQPADAMVVDADGGSPAGPNTFRIAEIGEQGWTLSRGEQVRAGADLNSAVERLSGDMLLFVRSGDRPRPDLVRRLREFAGRTDADVLAFPVWNAVGAGQPAGGDPGPAVLLPVGGPALLGLVYPAFSVGSFAIRRDAFRRLGGFAADARGDEAEHDLLNRALLGGLRLEVVPEPLATRITADRWAGVRTAHWAPAVPWDYDSDQQLRVTRAYGASLPWDLRDLPSLVRGLHDGEVGQQARIGEQEKHLRLQHDRLRDLEAWSVDLETQLETHRSVRAPALWLRHLLRAVRRRLPRLRR